MWCMNNMHVDHHMYHQNTNLHSANTTTFPRRALGSANKNKSAYKMWKWNILARENHQRAHFFLACTKLMVWIGNNDGTSRAIHQYSYFAYHWTQYSVNKWTCKLQRIIHTKVNKIIGIGKAELQQFPLPSEQMLLDSSPPFFTTRDDTSEGLTEGVTSHIIML